MLRTQAIMLAMLDVVPGSNLGIPHCGFTPTGAVVALLETPVKRFGAFLRSFTRDQRVER
jgi:hypothetical protein